MSGQMAWSRLSVCQRYENRLKKNANRLRKSGNNRVPSVKENDPIPKEKYCLEPLKDYIRQNILKRNNEHQCQSYCANHISCQSYFAPIISRPSDEIAENACNRAYKSSGMQVNNDAVQGGR